jgi:hypothetical protein
MFQAVGSLLIYKIGSRHVQDGRCKNALTNQQYGKCTEDTIPVRKLSFRAKEKSP